MNKPFLFLCLLVGFTSSIRPISQEAVYAGTVGTGLGLGLLAYKAGRGSLLAGVVVGAAGSWLAYYILNQFTPEGRLARAQAKFQGITQNTLATREFKTDEEFFNVLNEVYVLNDLPLIAVYNNLACLIQSGYEALSLLDAAKSESPCDLNIVQQCDILTPRIHHSLGLMVDAVKRIRASSEYIKQVKIYKEMQAAREKLMVQQQIAHSQTQIAHAQSQMAQAQMHQAYHR